MLRKRYYILFVARDEDGRVRKIPLPLQYVYGFVAAALVGAFTIVGLAGSYTRMLLKTERFNQVREDNQKLRKDVNQLAKVAHDRDVQVASLGALASEVTSLYGLRSHKVLPAKSTETSAASATPASLGMKDEVSNADVKMTFDQFNALRDQAMSGRVTRALEGGLTPGFLGDWTQVADAPSMWPVEGRVGSGFGQREDPINGEGAFHPGMDIEAAYGTPVRAAADGNATGENMGSGYGRQVVLDHGHDEGRQRAHRLGHQGLGRELHLPVVRRWQARRGRHGLDVHPRKCRRCALGRRQGQPDVGGLDRQVHLGLDDVARRDEGPRREVTLDHHA